MFNQHLYEHIRQALYYILRPEFKLSQNGRRLAYKGSNI